MRSATGEWGVATCATVVWIGLVDFKYLFFYGLNTKIVAPVGRKDCQDVSKRRMICCHVAAGIEFHGLDFEFEWRNSPCHVINPEKGPRGKGINFL